MQSYNELKNHAIYVQYCITYFKVFKNKDLKPNELIYKNDLAETSLSDIIKSFSDKYEKKVHESTMSWASTDYYHNFTVNNLPLLQEYIERCYEMAQTLVFSKGDLHYTIQNSIYKDASYNLVLKGPVSVMDIVKFMMHNTKFNYIVSDIQFKDDSIILNHKKVYDSTFVKILDSK